MLHAALVAVDELAAEVAVDFVEVQSVVAAEQCLDELDVLPHLVDGACASGVVACGLDAARESFVSLEAHHVVGLPAVERELLVLELVECCIGVDADGCITLFGHGVSLFNQICFHFFVCFR